MDGVLAVFPADLVDAFVEAAEAFDSDGRAEEVGLGVRGREVEERDHGRAVEDARTEEGVEDGPDDIDELVREIGRAGEREFGLVVLVALGAEEDEDLLRLELVAAGLHAGVLDVFRELGEDEARVVRCGREGPHLLDGRVVRARDWVHRKDARAAELAPDLVERGRELGRAQDFEISV